MEEKNHIIRSTIVSMILFLAFQYAFYSIVILGYGIKSKIHVYFFIISGVFHVLFTVFLVLMKDSFCIDPGGERLKRINLSNLLTIGRLSSLPTICFLIILSEQYGVITVTLVFICAVFLTDLFDGAVSRWRKEVTRIGKILDSASDYSVLIIISITFTIFRLIPRWFFILIMIRLLMNALGIAVLSLKAGSLKPETSFLGKTAIFCVMILYAFEIADQFDLKWQGFHKIVNALEYAVGGIVAVSLIEKVFMLAKQLIKKTK